jgi:hypothetical protein
MSDDRKLQGSIALTKLVHVMMDAKGKGGKPVRGIFIPLEGNLLTEKDKAVYMQVNVNFKAEQDQYGQNGFISKTTDSKIWKNLDEAGKKAAQDLSPILGNIKDWSMTTNDTSGAAAPDVLNEDDDLPF